MTDEYLFISDCHLHAGRPEISSNLVTFIESRASQARTLYILGDLFEVWLGDDDPVAEHLQIIAALKQLSQHCDIFFIAGNRDFLLGDSFAQRAGFTLLTEPVRICLDDQPALLMHGDLLCTDDADYQRFRQLVRSSAWKEDFLARPLLERQQIAAGLRDDSTAAMAQKETDIMDVNHDTVAAYFQQYNVATIIHGHTHRPAIHRYPGETSRIVLGDWNPEPSYLSWRAEQGFKLIDIRVS